jgi:hypothetical protein
MLSGLTRDMSFLNKGIIVSYRDYQFLDVTGILIQSSHFKTKDKALLDGIQ